MIKIDDEYFITADPKQFIVNRRQKTTHEYVAGHKVKNETNDTIVGYYNSVASAINGYRKDKQLRLVGEEKLTLPQFCERVAEMDAEITKKLKKLVTFELPEKKKKASVSNEKQES